MLRLFWVIIAISLIVGLAAAILGGSLSELGSGPGGLFGLPAMLLTLIALFVGVPASVSLARRLPPKSRRVRAAAVVAGGALVVAVGFTVVAHMIDPCVNGWWDGSTRVGSQWLCQRYGSELNWNSRFHLLAHAAPKFGLLAAYVWAINRWATTDRHPVDNKTP